MSAAMTEIEQWAGSALPEPYRAFLRGQEEDWPVGAGVLLYGRVSFVERNETYETKTYCPGFVTVGDDGGGRQILLPLTGGPVTIVDAGSMDPALSETVAGDFGEWLAAGCPLPGEEEKDDWEA